jgi:hypothetical protein
MGLVKKRNNLGALPKAGDLGTDCYNFSSSVGTWNNVWRYWEGVVTLPNLVFHSQWIVTKEG